MTQLLTGSRLTSRFGLRLCWIALNDKFCQVGTDLDNCGPTRHVGVRSAGKTSTVKFSHGVRRWVPHSGGSGKNKGSRESSLLPNRLALFKRRQANSIT